MALEDRGQDPTEVRVVGNRAVPRAVYAHLVTSWLEAGVEPGRVEEQLELFLRTAGYVYAEVKVRLGARGQLSIVVDEGTIERIVFPGQSGLTSVIASATFELDDGVFELEAVRRELDELELRLGQRVMGYEMTETSTKGWSPLQLRDVGVLAEAFDVPPVGRWVLSIQLATPFMSPGWGIGLSTTGPDGLVTELRYRLGELALDDDRFQLGAEVGTRVGELVGGGGAPFFSRAGVGVEWFSSALAFPPLRAVLGVDATYLNRLRRDLEGSTYDLLETDGWVGAHWQAGELRNALLRLGVDYRALLDSTLGTPEAAPRTTGRLRGFVDLVGEVIVFTSPGRRLDQQLAFEGHLRGYFQPEAYADFRLTATKSFPFDRYGDLRFEVRTAALFGSFGILDEYRVSDLFRGMYGDRLYTSGALTASTEVFGSLERDLVRASLFVDGIVHRGSAFGDEDESRLGIHAGVAGGVGLHGLVFSTFQASLYGVLGAIEREPVDAGINLSLMRLF